MACVRRQAKRRSNIVIVAGGHRPFRGLEAPRAHRLILAFGISIVNADSKLLSFNTHEEINMLEPLTEDNFATVASWMSDTTDYLRGKRALTCSNHICIL